MAVTEERLQAEIKKLDQSLTLTIGNSVARHVDAAEARIDTKIGSINENIKTLTTSVSAVKALEQTIAKLNVDELSKITLADVQAGKSARKEFSEFWAKEEEKVRRRQELKHDIENDLALKNLVSQKGLEAQIDKEVLLQLATSKQELTELLTKYNRGVNPENARFLANMSYGYILMAQTYKVASEHVTAVAAEKSASDIFKAVAWGAFKIAVSTGLGVLSAGLSNLILQPLLQGKNVIDEAKKGLGAFGDPKGTASQDDIDSAVDGGNFNKRSQAQSSVETAIGGIADLIGLPDDEPTRLIDPYDFFLDKEVELRKAAAYIATLKDEAQFEQVELGLNRKMKFTDLKKDPFWGFFKEQHTAEELNVKWGQVSRLLTVYMRRLCWRMYCRAQWQKATYDYSFQTDESFATKNKAKLDGPDIRASVWDRDVWKTTGTGDPKHWDKICSDFRGPEHDPYDPYTVATRGAAAATENFSKSTWISLAVVQCCQIERSKGFGHFSWNIDLERERRYAGQPQGEQVKTAFTDYELLFGDLTAQKDNPARKLEDVLQDIRTKGGEVIRISEIRFGRWESLGKATGKKGRLEGPNDKDGALLVGAGAKVTVMLTSTALTTKDAWVEIYAPDGETPDGKTKTKSLTTKKRASTNFATSHSQSINFQAPKDADFYLVKLDARVDLQKTKRMFFVSDEWWFRTIVVADSDDWN